VGWLKGADVIVNGYVGPVFGKDALAVRLTLYELHGLEAANPTGSKGKTADAAEGVKQPEHDPAPAAEAAAARGAGQAIRLRL
jgi:hypothetical protein